MGNRRTVASATNEPKDRRQRWPVGAWLVTTGVAALGLALPGCSQAPADEVVHVEPAKVQSGKNGQLGTVTLETRAVERIGVQTVEVRTATMAHGGAEPALVKVIPYSAVLYDESGGTFAYANPQAMVFERRSITIDYVEGDLAVLSAGPTEGTPVVTVGAAELFGAELGVDH